MSDTNAIVQDQVTGLFGFRLEMGRTHDGTRLQVRRTGFATEKAALTEYRRLCRQRDARHPKPRLGDTVQSVCDGWVLAREQELEPNTVYNYRWLLGLIYPHVGGVRASRLSARMVECAYRDLETAGYSRTTLRTLNLVLVKAFDEQTGRSLGVRRPRESDDERQVWTLEEARRFADYVREDRLYLMWRLLLVTGLRRGELCGLRCGDLELGQGALTVRRQIVVEDPGCRLRVKPSKSHNGLRALKLDPVTLERLAEWAAGPASRYLFTGRTGQPMRPDNLTDRFNQLAVAAGCPPARASPAPAPDRVEPARRRIRHPRGRRTTRPRRRHPHALLHPRQRHPTPPSRPPDRERHRGRVPIVHTTGTPIALSRMASRTRGLEPRDRLRLWG